MLKKLNRKKFDVIVIGAGPAGMAAAISAKEAGCEKVMLIDRHCWAGGILQQCIHPGFGLKKFGLELTGPEYAEMYYQKLMSMEIDFLMDTTVLNINLNKDVLITNSLNGLNKLGAKAVIFATGCREKPRGAINIPGYRGAGIFTAGNAQRLINIDGLLIGKKAIILGSGDIGLIMARRLTLEGIIVEAVVEKMPFPAGLPRNLQQCVYDFEIPLLLNRTISFIEGKHRVSGVMISEIKNGSVLPFKKSRIDCDTILLSAGLIPETELAKQISARICSNTNGLEVDNNMQTSAEGFFACGNTVSVYDLVDYASIDGEIAGKSAYLYIRGSLKKGKGFTIIREGEAIKNIVPKIFRRDMNIFSKKEIYVRVLKNINKPVFIIRNRDRVLGCINENFAHISEATIVNLDKYMDDILKSEEIYIDVKERERN